MPAHASDGQGGQEGRRDITTLGEDLGGLFAEEDEEFDPLATDDFDIDQDELDDENPYDTVDYPTMRNMPEEMQRDAVFSPATQGSAKAAIEALFDRNPARRPVFLAIIDLCREGCPSSTVVEKIDAFQEDNLSVYTPTTLCRMLERAGALEVEVPEAAEAKEDVEEGVEYLEITKRVDPVWTSTEVALEIYDQESSGAAFWDILGRDGAGKYRAVYQMLLEGLAAEPRKREWFEENVDNLEVVQRPRRFGGHFIDMLERTYCIEWHNPRWHITDLGRTVLAEMQLQVPQGEE